MTSHRITGVTTKCSENMVKIEEPAKPSIEILRKINYRDPHTMPLGELYRLTGGWDGVREALGITMCTLSYKDKCAKILRDYEAKQAKIKAECAISIERDRKKNAESSALFAARYEALLAVKRSAKRKADEWGKLFFYFLDFLIININFNFLI